MKKENMLNLKDLDRDGLIELCESYDQYIKNICDDDQNKIYKYPVCINEYINNEFEEQSRDHDYDDWLNAMSFNIIEEFENIFNKNENNNISITEGELYYKLEDKIKEVLSEGI